VAVCCSVLQCVAVLRELRACPMTRLDTLLPFAFLYTTAARTATDSNCNTRNTLQHTVSRTAVCCSVLQCVAVRCSVLRCVAIAVGCTTPCSKHCNGACCNVQQLQQTATHCNTVQHAATCSNYIKLLRPSQQTCRAAWCNLLLSYCSVLQLLPCAAVGAACVAVCCRLVQCVAVCCSVLQTGAVC